MSDRFDFEQQILKCWNIIDDLKELDEGLFEGWLKFDQDNVSNHILGVANTYEIKFNKLWNLFEDVMMAEVRKNKMLEEECAALREQLEKAEKKNAKR
jgi:hypothetical protein